MDASSPRATVIVVGRPDMPPEYPGGEVARGSRIGILGDLDLLDAPFSATSYTAAFIRDQQARSVADVVQSDSAVRVARGFGNFQELYFVRGYPVYSDDVSFNGLYGLLPRQYVAAELLERVEVFRGANSFLNGAAPGGSGIGGAFNLVPKHALDEDFTRLTAGYENNSRGYGAFDVSLRIGDTRQLGLRFNGARRDGEGSIEQEGTQLSVVGLGADYRSGPAKLSVDVGWQDRKLTAPRPSVTPSGLTPMAPAASKNFAQPWTRAVERDTFGAIRWDYDFGDATNVWAAAGVRGSTEGNILANPTADADGVTRALRFDNQRRDRVATGQLGVSSEFHTGGIANRVTLSADSFGLDSKNAFATSEAPGFAGSIFDPVAVEPPDANARTGGQLSSPSTTSRVKTASGAIADTVSLAGDRLRFILGVRYQAIEQYGYGYDSGLQTSHYDESAVTPVGAILFRLTGAISLYANYIEGLIQGGIAPTAVGNVVVANAGEVFSPFRSKQYEAGLKYDQRDFGATIAAFRIRKPASLLDGNLYRRNGEQVNQGVEVAWFGTPWPALRVLGGVTALDAKATRTQGGLYDGNRVIGVPRVQSNLDVEWDVGSVSGLTLESRVVFTGSQSINAANTASLAAWTRLDLGARYTRAYNEKRVTARADLTNATNRDYWASAGGQPGANYLVLGAPRTVTVSLSLEL